MIIIPWWLWWYDFLAFWVVLASHKKPFSWLSNTRPIYFISYPIYFMSHPIYILYISCHTLFIISYENKKQLCLTDQSPKHPTYFISYPLFHIQYEDIWRNYVTYSIREKCVTPKCIGGSWGIHICQNQTQGGGAMPIVGFLETIQTPANNEVLHKVWAFITWSLLNQNAGRGIS